MLALGFLILANSRPYEGLAFGVPVALATDDEGVSRGSMTQEYQRAVETYHLSYAQLKKMARASISTRRAASRGGSGVPPSFRASVPPSQYSSEK